mgnify:CR=1 FL=1
MNRFEKLFTEKQKEITSVYFTAGFPTKDSTVEIIKTLSDAGVDMIEIGVPFSDPMADGPVIQHSSQQALENGMSQALLFDQLKDVRKITNVPLILMGYLNTALQFGFEKYCQKAAEVGIDGFIIPDIPLEEYETNYKPIAEKYGLKVVEDCAQAHGATYKGRKAGTFGDAAGFSFYPGKNLYAFGEGGSVTCDKEEYYKHMTRLKNQGCDVRYYHDEIGYNYRLEGMQGAVLSVSLKYLPEWTKRRQEIGRRYLREINNPLITMQAHPDNTESVFHLFVITVPDQKGFVQYMADADVECNMHYPVPCHLQKAYAYLGYKVGDCPNAEYLASHCVTLPLFPEMREDEIKRVVELCNAYKG